jgi:hypothetical protein
LNWNLKEFDETMGLKFIIYIKIKIKEGKEIKIMVVLSYMLNREQHFGFDSHHHS